MSFRVPNQYRFRDLSSLYGSDDNVGKQGAFLIPFQSHNLRVIASDGMRWEHVSVSLPNRTPNWKEMCYIKDLFWDEEDVVIQYHPPKSQHIDNHPYCLHLWRPIKEKIPTPPSIMVGVKK